MVPFLQIAGVRAFHARELELPEIRPYVGCPWPCSLKEWILGFAPWPSFRRWWLTAASLKFTFNICSLAEWSSQWRSCFSLVGFQHAKVLVSFLSCEPLLLPKVHPDTSRQRISVVEGLSLDSLTFALRRYPHIYLSRDANKLYCIWRSVSIKWQFNEQENLWVRKKSSMPWMPRFFRPNPRWHNQEHLQVHLSIYPGLLSYAQMDHKKHRQQASVFH